MMHPRTAYMRQWRQNNRERIKDREAAYAKEWRENNKERVKAQKQRWIQKPENRERTRKYARKYRASGKFSWRKYQLEWRYGLTLEQFDAMLAAQNWCCAACGSADPQSKSGWEVDHNHKTNQVRAILCRPCNNTIGHAKESLHRLLACYNYLRATNG